MDQQGLWERAERLRGATDEAARLAQNVYLSFLLLGTYIAIIIWSTTDVQLLKKSPVILPLLNVPLPIVEFYVVIPWLLWLFHFNLLLHLTFLAQRLHWLNAVLTAFPDNIVREEQRIRLFPFPFSAMLIGRHRWGRMRVLLGFIVWITVILLPLGLLLLVQVCFLPYHNTIITWSHRGAVLADMMLLWFFLPPMLVPEQRVSGRTALFRRFWPGRAWPCSTLVAIVFSLSIAVLPEEAPEAWMAWMASHWLGDWGLTDPEHTGKPIFWPTYWLLERPGAPFHRNLKLPEQVLVAGEPSAEVLAALQSGDEHEQTQGLNKVTWLILTNRDLRGANLRETLLAKVDLRGANLKGANLVKARLFTSNLSSFSLSKGERCIDDTQLSENHNFCRTSLRGAKLQNAQLWKANLQDVQLQDADLQGAQLQGANLRGAQLQGAVFADAQLQGATLALAQLQGADLRNTQLQGADLQMARLQGATLVNAQLQGAVLILADLQGADLQNSTIGSANFTQANLTLSNLQSLSSSPLDEKQYEQLEKILTHALNDERLRTHCLKQIKAAVGQPDRLQQALPPEQVLCDDSNLFPSCLTKGKITDYAYARASFIGNLGCNDAAIARGVVRNLVEQARVNSFKARQSVVHPEPDPMLLALAKTWVTISKEDCPGWATLSVDQKITLRNWAIGKTLAP